MIIRFNRIEWFASAGISLLSFCLGAFVGVTSPVKAEPFPNCFMETETGERIDLSSICGKKIASPQSNSSEIKGQESPYRVNVMMSNVPGQYLQTGRFNSVIRLGTVAPITSSGGFSPLFNSSTQWKQLSDVSSLRSDPFGGSLMGQLYKGEPVRVYRDTRTDNSVYVETLRGRGGWIDIWALPDASGLLP